VFVGGGRCVGGGVGLEVFGVEETVAEAAGDVYGFGL
jgi:hypothetical protein